MNVLVLLILLAIIGFVVLKNWDKIQPLFSKVGNNDRNSESIAINRADIERLRKERISFLVNERGKIESKIENSTHELKYELKQIDLELALLEEQKNNVDANTHHNLPVKRWFK